MKRDEIRIQLIQIREDSLVRLEEIESFAKYSQINTSQIEVINVFDRPDFKFEEVKTYNGVFIGGASEASVLDPIKYTFVPHLIQYMNYLVENKIPVFASCFGYQLAILAQGGAINKDTENFEMGTYPIQLTKAAQEDILLREVPNNFWAISVHQEKAQEVPKTCELLGFTNDSTHILKVKDAPFWAFQFHPELDKECLTLRLKAYKEKYTNNQDHFEEVIQSIVETPESNKLLDLFISKVILNS